MEFDRGRRSGSINSQRSYRRPFIYQPARHFRRWTASGNYRSKGPCRGAHELDSLVHNSRVCFHDPGAGEDISACTIGRQQHVLSYPSLTRRRCRSHSRRSQPQSQRRRSHHFPGISLPQSFAMALRDGSWSRAHRRGHSRGHCGDRHRRADALFEHQGSSQRVCDLARDRIICLLYPPGDSRPGFFECTHRVFDCCGIGLADRGGDRECCLARHHDTQAYARLVRAHGGDVRFLCDFGNCQGDPHRSGSCIQPMKTIVIEAIDVVKSLGEGAGRVLALKGVSVSLKGGELTLLMGPSGSGKTTLLSVLGCMLSPTAGLVRISGRTITGLRPGELAKVRRQNIGFIFQSFHLFPTLTAEENARLPLDVRGERSPAALDKAQQALIAVGLSHKFNSFPRDLSGGEQQRVAIARAVVGTPSVVLADEPTAALDRENGLAIMSVLADIAKDPAHAVFVVTHDPRIEPFADRILRIEDGLVVADEARTKRLKIG